MPHALPIISYLTRSQYLEWIKIHESPCYVIVSNLLLLHSFSPRYIPCYTVIKQPQHMSFGNVNDRLLHLYETTGKIVILCINYLYFFLMRTQKILYQMVGGFF
jgi:hypothetical protein